MERNGQGGQEISVEDVIRDPDTIVDDTNGGGAAITIGTPEASPIRSSLSPLLHLHMGHLQGEPGH